MRPLDSSFERRNSTTSHLSCIASTGFHFSGEETSRSLHSCTSAFTAVHRRTSLRTAFLCHHCQAGAICVQLTPALCLYPGQRRQHMAHGHSLLQDQLYGTVFQRISDFVTVTRTSVENSRQTSLICDCCLLLRFCGTAYSVN